jgi:hypothetical protein
MVLTLTLTAVLLQITSKIISISSLTLISEPEDNTMSQALTYFAMYKKIDKTNDGFVDFLCLTMLLFVMRVC